MIDEDLAQLRRDFSREALSEATVDADPFRQFAHWLNEALRSQITDANAMTLATVGADARPSARIVLLKGFGERGFEFYTNYESKKGSDLTANPSAVLHFYWPELERQAAVYGCAERTGRSESEAYFASRPLESRLGAWASRQSGVIASREVLEQRVEELRQEFAGRDVPLPPFWGGFRVVPDRFEFWQGRPNRLHDRIVYELDAGVWKIFRLSP